MTERSISYKSCYDIVYKIIDDISDVIIKNQKFNDVCVWALGNMKNTKNKVLEREWGNFMINQVNNGQWTTKLGERLVFELLTRLGCEPRRPRQICRYRPDYETKTHMVEVKTRNFSTTGTAGEKVFGTPLKYAEIPLLYGKPLMIVCVGYQEYEMTHGATPIFGDKVRPKTAEFLKFYELNQITFVPCSQLINQVNSL